MRPYSLAWPRSPDFVSSALDGVTQKLVRSARVADIGCGHGHSTVIMAKAFPNSRVCGFDVHEASIVTERVTFEVANASDYPSHAFDLICFFDCLHDMRYPERALRHAADALARSSAKRRAKSGT